MVTITIKCRHCGSENLLRNGLTRNGKQRYHYKDCHLRNRDHPQPLGYSEAERQAILRAYEERSSLRGLPRTFGVARNTVNSWLKKADALPPLSGTLRQPVPDAPEQTTLELDEMWSFILKKTNKRWVRIALCRLTRQVVAYVIGDRSERSCRQLWEKIPAAYRVGHGYTDFREACQKVISDEQHTTVGKESGQTAHVERWNLGFSNTHCYQ